MKLAYGGPVPGYESYEEARDSASDEPLADEPHGEDLLYSSGTTGRPKGIKRPLPDYRVDEPLYMVPMVFGTMYGFDEETVYLSPAPVYHAAPLRFMGAVHVFGGTVVMMERFEAEATLEAIQRFGATHTQMVPTMFVRLLKLPEEVQATVAAGTLSMGHARALLGLPTEIDQRRLARDIIARTLSVRETESMVKRIAESGRDQPAAATAAAPVDVHTRAAEERLRLALGTRVRIVRRGARGRIEIAFTSEDELIRIYEQLADRS